MVVGVTGIIPYTSGIFLPHLATAFGWDKAAVGMGQSFQAYGAAAAVPVAGWLADRFGVRMLAAGGLAGFALCLLALSNLNGNLKQLWMVMALAGIAASACGPLVFTRVINQHFSRMRGLALSLVLSCVGLGAMAYPVIISRFIERYGWRTAYLVLAAWVLAALPLVVVLVGQTSGPITPSRTSISRDRGSILRQGIFWRLLLAFFLAATAVTGYLLHLVAMLQEFGMSRDRSAGLQGVIGITVIASRLLVGPAVDRVFAPRVASLCMLTAAVGAGLLAQFHGTYALVAVLCLGVGLGSEVDLISYMIARYYPIQVYGRVYGLIYGAALIGAGASPAWMGMVSDVRNYASASWISSGLFILAAALFLTCPPFPHRDGDMLTRRSAAGDM